MSMTRTGMLATSMALYVMLGAGAAWAQSRPGTSDQDTGVVGDEARQRDGAGSARNVAGADGEQEVGPESGPEGGLEVDVGETMPWSEGVGMERRHEAREIFLEANELALGRFFATAAAKYKEAIELWPHPAFHYNLAVAQMSLDDPVSAYASLDAALRHGPEPLGQDKYKEARQYRELLGSQLARVSIVCNVPGAQVSLDGTPLFVGPGEHQAVMRPGGYFIEATKPGHIADSRQIILAAGRESRYEMVLQREERKRRFDTWVPWTVVGAGVAMVATGGVFHWQAAGEFDEYDRLYVQFCPIGCHEAQLTVEQARKLEDVGDLARTERTVAQVSYIAGGVALATGVALFYVNRERTVLREVRGEPDNVMLVPMVSPRGVGMTVGLRF